MKSVRTSTTAWMAGAIVLAVSISACGSDNDTGSSAPSSPTTVSAGATSAPAAPTGAEVRVGVIGSISGVQASSQGGVDDVAKAWESSVNAKGGLPGGQKVKVFIEDDAGDPSKAVVAVKRLVEQDKVVAIIGENSNVDQAWADYISKKGVPVVGGLSVNVPQFTNADFFPTGSAFVPLTYGAMTLGKESGSVFGLLYCAESPQCAQIPPVNKAVASALKMTLPVSSKVSSTAPSYADVCQSLKQAKVNALSIGAGSAVQLNILDQCRQAGLTSKLIAVDGQVTAGYLKSPAADGSLGAVAQRPWFDDSTPASKEYRDALTEYAPGLGDLDGTVSQYVWIAGKLFEAAVKAAGSTTVTPDSVKQGLYALKDETLGGLSGPLNYVKDKPTVLGCYFVIGVKDGAFTAPKGLEPFCPTQAELAPVYAGLGG